MKPFTSKHMCSSPLNQNGTNRQRVQALSQKTKDSLHNQANLYKKPFFSPKHQVNVDPEDGVLENRPTFGKNIDDFSKLPKEKRGGYTVEKLEARYPKSENRQLTYDKIDKPFVPKGGPGMESNIVSKSGINRSNMRGVNPDNIKPIPQEHKDAAKKGATGNIGIIGGAVGAVGKAAARAVAKKAFAKNNPGVTLGGASKNLPKGTGKPRYGKGSGPHEVITGGRSMQGMQSAAPKKRPFLDKAFDAFGEAAIQYKNRLPWR
tara:strand:- start:48 stop:833 length:786 start_codon:yes stop_codon:yes gene_type:complete